MDYKKEYDGWLELIVNGVFVKVLYKYQDVLTTIPCPVLRHTSKRRFIRLMGDYVVLDKEGKIFVRENNSRVWEILTTNIIPAFEKDKLNFVLCEECLKEIKFLKSTDFLNIGGKT